MIRLPSPRDEIVPVTGRCRRLPRLRIFGMSLYFCGPVPHIEGKVRRLAGFGAFNRIPPTQVCSGAMSGIVLTCRLSLATSYCIEPKIVRVFGSSRPSASFPVLQSLRRILPFVFLR